MKSAKELYLRRRYRTSGKVKVNNNGRMRLAVFRSSKHIYAQIIDDVKGSTLVAASSVAIKEGINKVVFDRGGYLYHGRVKALAEAAREGGLSF